MQGLKLPLIYMEKVQDRLAAEAKAVGRKLVDGTLETQARTQRAMLAKRERDRWVARAGKGARRRAGVHGERIDEQLLNDGRGREHQHARRNGCGTRADGRGGRARCEVARRHGQRRGAEHTRSRGRLQHTRARAHTHRER